MRKTETLEAFEVDADGLVEALNRHLQDLRRIRAMGVAYAEAYSDNVPALRHLAHYVGEVHDVVSEEAAQLRVELDEIFDPLVVLVDGDGWEA